MSNANTEPQQPVAAGDHEGAPESIATEAQRLLAEGDEQGLQDLILSEVQRILAMGDGQNFRDIMQQMSDVVMLTLPPLSGSASSSMEVSGSMQGTADPPSSNVPSPRLLRSTLPPRNDAYDLLTQHEPPFIRPADSVHFRERGINYATGMARRLPRSHFTPRYGPAREAPLSSAGACRCQHFRYEHAIHRMHENGEFDTLALYEREHRLWVRSRVLGGSNFGTTSNRQLVELRQTRALVGLDVSEYDVEIARRVLANPGRWGSLGWAMRSRGWVEEVINDGEDYVLY